MTVKEWTNTGDVHEERGLKGRSRRSVRKIASDNANSLDAHVARVVKRSPKLTPAQRDQLAAILKPFATENAQRRAGAA